MCARTSLNEKRILTFSALLASGFAGAGLVLGLLVGSLVIVFDGVYSLVSLLLTLLSLAVSRFIERPSKRQFPFGKAVLEPVVIAVKGSVILAIVSVSLYSAVTAMFTGGREVDAGIATLFGVVNVLGCGYAWWYIANKSKRFSSGLIEAESKQWQMDTLLSVAVTLGFVTAWLVSISPFAKYAVYADPMMMILMSFYFIKVPFDMLMGALRELLMMKPDEAICKAVDKEVSALDKQVSQQLKVAAVTKVGRELRVNLDVHSKGQQVEVAELDKTRRVLKDKLSKLSLDLNLTMNIAS
ncbi:cation diffusion facilitator family transporter [Vibrio tubiashii]|uniref:cation diffusion facilitator family transporter n=1 Tax=Vibrio tubiashii TaxID=29498 RepID=UPI001EFD93B8|nr:cation diffusion facilitator family transporter [Vibrio tubiashii]MCG9580455.1 cation diffusion facilitator family transporter [Vibrio tubiashii]MCG9614046.1 cation diffusion facilitator family transporter [Vibrio tubiashii]MCG9685745.1 cation diffusion facilitator family transporter [Vibrio tubiashii]